MRKDGRCPKTVLLGVFRPCIFSVIIYNIVYDKQVQDYVREQINAAKNKGTSSMELKTRQYIMPLNKIAAHKGDYERVKNALLRLQSKRFEYIDKTYMYEHYYYLYEISLDEIKLKEAEKIEKSDKLLKLQVDIGKKE